MTRVRLAVGVFFAEMVASSISAASGNYVLNGDFSQGRDHWDGEGVVISDPDNKEDRVLKIRLDDYAKGISQGLTLPRSITALVGGFEHDSSILEPNSSSVDPSLASLEKQRRESSDWRAIFG